MAKPTETLGGPVVFHSFLGIMVRVHIYFNWYNFHWHSNNTYPSSDQLLWFLGPKTHFQYFSQFFNINNNFL